MTEPEFLSWYIRLNLPKAALDFIRQIRSSPGYHLHIDRYTLAGGLDC
jgi:hypothetical protein